MSSPITVPSCGGDLTFTVETPEITIEDGTQAPCGDMVGVLVKYDGFVKYDGTFRYG